MKFLDVHDTLDPERHPITSIPGDCSVHIELAEDTWSGRDGTYVRSQIGRITPDEQGGIEVSTLPCTSAK